jgi:PIN domain nuclease of toxin-antitoxin system
VIVLDSHVWFWWINLEHQRLSAYLFSQMEGADRVLNGRLLEVKP